MATNGANYIPDRTINFNVTADEGNIFLGVGTVDLPEIQKMTDTLSGSGIAGEVETRSPDISSQWRQPSIGMPSRLRALIS